MQLDGKWVGGTNNPQDQIDLMHDNLRNTKVYECQKLPDASIDGVATIANAGINAGALILTNSPSELGPALGFLAQQVGRVQQLIVVGDLTTITASTEDAAAAALQLRH